MPNAVGAEAGGHRRAASGAGPGPGLGDVPARGGKSAAGGPAARGPARGGGRGAGRRVVPSPAGPGGGGRGGQCRGRPPVARPGPGRVAGRAGRRGRSARAAQSDLEARRHAVHRARGLRPYTDASGTSHLHAKGTPEEVAMVMAAIAPFAERALVAAGEQGRRERPEAYAFDGLVAMAGAGGAQAPRAEVLFRVDHEVMLRGYPLDGEVCEVPGFGPVSTQAVADAMDCGDPILKAVLTKGKDVVSVAHLGRRPTAAQQTALDWLFPSCAAEGCGTRAAHLQSDHRVDWSQIHVTVLDLLERLCKFHHYQKTYQGWALVHGRGKRAFVPPDDPRHPGQRPEATEMNRHHSLQSGPNAAT